MEARRHEGAEARRESGAPASARGFAAASPPALGGLKVVLRALCAMRERSHAGAARWSARAGGAVLGCLMLCTASPAAQDLPLITVDRDDVEITESCRVRIGSNLIADSNENGVLHITGENIVVQFDGPPLLGATTDQAPDAYTGTGIRITGRNVTLRDAAVRGYKCAVHATGTDGLVLERVDVAGNFRPRLKSTPDAEDASDWLYPHDNDDNQWLKNYGAGIYVEDAAGISISKVTARLVQNGIILDRVEDSRIFDNDCSFLSGWGLALWRSSRNVISRNAFDFCVRGYSHGVYNRGQDSAGILLFEQCNDNVIAENSATHCGDGVFGFAGKEALGEGEPRHDPKWYRRRGCNGNRFLGNDFSYAAAHGLEITFSFENEIRDNRFIENAICGVWAGYCQDTLIAGNVFEGNGQAGYGLQRGGINIEHGHGNRIIGNLFTKNAAGVHLWWDEDQGLREKPWSQVNEGGSEANVIAHNRLVGNEVGVHLRDTGSTTQFADNAMEENHQDVLTEGDSPASKLDTVVTVPPLRLDDLPGEHRPVGARPYLRGRENILMAEWGPYDWQGPYLKMVQESANWHVYQLLGTAADIDDEAIEVEGPVRLAREGSQLTIAALEPMKLHWYRLRVNTPQGRLERSGTLARVVWDATVFGYRSDPQQDVEAWREEGRLNGVMCPLRHLKLPFGMRGPSDMSMTPQVTISQLPRDRFGLMAETTCRIPAGSWRVKTTSDDGIRVWMDEELVIDDWTHHVAARHDHEFEIEEEREVTWRVEYFELDGMATLMVEFERAE